MHFQVSILALSFEFSGGFALFFIFFGILVIYFAFIGVLALFSEFSVILMINCSQISSKIFALLRILFALPDKALFLWAWQDQKMLIIGHL